MEESLEQILEWYTENRYEHCPEKNCHECRGAVIAAALLAERKASEELRAKLASLTNEGAEDGRHYGQACPKHDLTGCGCGRCLDELRAKLAEAEEQIVRHQGLIKSCVGENDCQTCEQGIAGEWNPMYDMAERAKKAESALSSAQKQIEAAREAYSERVAQLVAHRVCCGNEHDGISKFHGYCVVCGVPWPCEYAGKPHTLASLASAGESCEHCGESPEDHKRPCGNCGDEGHAKWECVLPPETGGWDCLRCSLKTIADLRRELSEAREKLGVAEKAVEAITRWLMSVKKLDPDVEGLDATTLLSAAALTAIKAQEKPHD